ncbi:MAG: PTS glucose transporter subunit IIA, partial [Erysipelotrichaceae bacterium]|nr:PTS glucose transporter subunit IIA [Erysipelotrichaceae bacterium]
GFKILSKKQGDKVRVGDPIVKVDVKELSQKYDMSTMLIIVDSNGREVEFLEPQKIVKGQSIIKNYE